ncbi:Cof-type HAD-IIB family hydrolase [Pseudalkalibacillus salsuginis]|uniref:Cof-type HAD-IIB family hydrolase n=1 Tax=Pseudalkalibacillus salsuginis TaxID=2910972 RepID=UPI001F36D4B0|nr:Cof-type HAD-IIB family hydrolase [Pseudalkalibacillus salsuginis]MCF6409233.1 Cof-type HAD-IIB family hydrolase [Pseudalkalibacillus salsuginis]
MSQPYLIAVDLDGTLLKDDKTVSIQTKKVLKRAMEHGHHVVISTGRPYRGSEQFYHELDLTTPIINFNGAFIHHPKNPGWGRFHSPMDMDVAQSIIETCLEFEVKNVIAEVLDDVYLHYEDEFIINSFLIDKTNLNIGNLIQVLPHNPTSILVRPNDHHVKELRELLKAKHAEVIDHRVWGAPWNIIEVVKAGLNKAVGLKRVAESLNIPQERVIAFGDEDNDLEMIEYAGHGIAMGNAIPELKNIANGITKSNEDDGIAYFLEDLLALKESV